MAIRESATSRSLFAAGLDDLIGIVWFALYRAIYETKPVIDPETGFPELIVDEDGETYPRTETRVVGYEEVSAPSYKRRPLSFGSLVGDGVSVDYEDLPPDEVWLVDMFALHKTEDEQGIYNAHAWGEMTMHAKGGQHVEARLHLGGPFSV